MVARQSRRSERTRERARNVCGAVQRFEVRPTGHRGSGGVSCAYAEIFVVGDVVGAGAGGARDFFQGVADGAMGGSGSRLSGTSARGADADVSDDMEKCV